MLNELSEILKHSLMITGFVFAMMLLIEYINVITKGNWQNKLRKNKFKQVLLGVFMGIIPGCLGSYTVVSLYSHGILSFGALTATMIASTGDEAYVMFSIFPKTALIITAITAIIGIVVGLLIDMFFKKQHKLLPESVHGFEVHEHDWCNCWPNRRQIKENMSHISFPRGLLLGILSIIFILSATDSIGHSHADGMHESEWIMYTLMFVTVMALFIVMVVPDHFLEEHLWKHVLKKHLLRIFLWTFGALIVVHFVQHFIDVEALIIEQYFTVLAIAVILGLIPESGPHIVFVTLFATGTLPFGILLASSIVQDGHGTLPLIPFSRKSFVALKLINLVIGFIVGTAYFFF